MEFFTIAAAAGRRWQERARVRDAAITKIREGRALETETVERIQQRIARLAVSTQKAHAAVERALIQPAGHRLVQAIGTERVIGKSDFLDINFIELALAVARFVGRINIRTSQGRSIGYGTGFMVSPRLLLTNNHVLETAASAQHSLVEFDYQNDRAGRPLPVVGFKLEPGTFFMTNKELDFSLVAVSETSLGGAVLQRYGWNRLIADQGKALKGEPLNIIQHPRGDAKQIVLRSNELVDLFDQYAHYVTDTEPGSSGSPVFNDQWEVVALHHSAVPKIDAQGNYIANDGTIWNPGDNPDDLAWVANEGIRISSLVEYISRQPLSGFQAQLQHDLLNLEPPSPLEAAAASQAGGGNGNAAGADGLAGQPKRGPDGATWTIPLTVTVQLGTPLPSPVDAGGAIAAVTQGVTPTDGGPFGAAGGVAVAQVHNAALAEALEEATAAADRPYYDAGTDQQARDAYYAAIDPARGDLFEQLSGLLKASHTTQLDYKPAKHLYPWVDWQPPRPNSQGAKRIASIYSGERFDAEELIRQDFEIDQARASMREAARRPALAGQVTMLNDMALEAALPYNCEHVVPQSWFNKREPMRGDLHHLFACEIKCNSFRANTPFFDFADFDPSMLPPGVSEVIKGDCGKSETSKFEPARGKGAVARATLYFLLRYPGEINRTVKEYKPDRIDTLVAWHKAEPPSDYERHRNAAIFAKQGNRNPFVDFPDWVDHVDFALGLGGASGLGLKAPDTNAETFSRWTPDKGRRWAAVRLTEGTLPEDEDAREDIVTVLVKAAIKSFSPNKTVVLATLLGPMGLGHGDDIRRGYFDAIQKGLASFQASMATLTPESFTDDNLKTVCDVCDLVLGNLE